MMKKILFILCLTSSLSFVEANPFAIPFKPKKDLTHADYVELNRQINRVNIKPTVENMYQSIKDRGFTTLGDFSGRCSHGSTQILIDPARKLYPEKRLVQIGRGGDRCVVCCGPLSGKYPNYIRSLASALESTGFNGSFLYYIGGWPNPTGEEVKYAAVPYSFKIFAMVEAHQLGFTNVLWVDSACYPLRGIDPLFEWIEKNGALLNSSPPSPDSWRLIFPQTRDVLYKHTGTDVLGVHFINSIVMGLKMGTPKSREFVRMYYDMARLGTPFLSCFPEEWVFTAIIGQDKFRDWIKKPRPILVRGSTTNSEDSPQQFDVARKAGSYFYQRKGR